MESPSGRQDTPLGERAITEPHRYELTQLVRILESLQRERADTTREPVGHDADPWREAVRFRSSVELGFPAADVARARLVEADSGASEQAELTVAFMGLAGPLGALPYHYAVRILQLEREGDAALRDFLDVFNHRLVSLFHRAATKYRFPLSYELERRDPEARSSFTESLYCLQGLGTPGLRGRLPVADETLLPSTGLFHDVRRSARGLTDLLSSYFDLPIRVEQFCGQWLDIAAGDRTSLPTRKHPDGLNCQLGVSTVSGEAVWDVQSKFRVRVGPLGFERFSQLTPAGSAFPALWHIVRLFVGPEFDFDLQVVLSAERVVPCQLSADDSVASPRLGWTTFLASGPLEEDFEEAVFVNFAA